MTLCGIPRRALLSENRITKRETRRVSLFVYEKVTEFANGEVKVDTKEGSKTIMSDSVILSVGYKEENTLYNNLQFDIPDLYLLGDAKKVSNIMYAIWDAFEVANHI